MGVVVMGGWGDASLVIFVIVLLLDIVVDVEAEGSVREKWIWRSEEPVRI